jgi:hypothetical protein
MSIRSARSLFLSLSLSLWPLLGCVDPPESSEPVGKLSAALQFPLTHHDVISVRFDVMAAGGGCDDAALASKTIPLESEPLPASVAGPGSGMHQFADGLFVLAPGSYLVCATPLTGSGPSAECGRAQNTATVVAGQTAEVLLVSQCQGKPNGGLDVVVALNDPPQITGLDLTPSKFITTCEQATLAVTATDPDGDAISYVWAVLSGPEGSSLHPGGTTATFSGPAGDYLLAITASDVHGASTMLTFPVHVSAATCAAPPAVQAIFNLRCFSCHIANSAGGLSLATPEAAFANLVGVHAVGTGCMDRVRVIPGSPATSYLIAKLRNIPPICGLPMPRNRPPLPEEEIATIESWINGLPH